MGGWKTPTTWLFIVCVFAVVTARAQTVSGFTANSSGYQSLYVPTSGVAITDLFDQGTSNLDPSKQQSLAGGNAPWDMVGTSSAPVLRVASGTYSGNSAIAMSVRLANLTTQSGSPKLSTGGVVLLIQDATLNATFGIGFSATSSAKTLHFVTVDYPYSLTKALTFTLGTAFATDTRYSYEDSGSKAFVASSVNDAWLTFVVLTSDITSQTVTNAAGSSTSLSSFAFTDSTRYSLFTSTQGSGLGSGGINADYLSLTGNGSNSDPLSFGSVTYAIPEPSTYAFAGACLLPLVGLTYWRRRRAAAKS
jgi:hypothetical protein